MFGKIAVTLLIGACGVQHASGYTATLDTRKLNGTSDLRAVMDTVELSGASPGRTSLLYTRKCDGTLLFHESCVNTSAEPTKAGGFCCSSSWETDEVFDETTEVIVIVLDTAPVGVTGDESFDIHAYYNDALQVPHQMLTACRTVSTDAQQTVSWSESCNCVTPTLSINSPSPTDTLRQLLGKISFSSSVPNSPTSRVFIVANHYGSSGVTGCADSAATEKLLISINDISASPSCENSETQESFSGTLKGCALTSLKTDLTSIKPAAGEGPSQITLYYSLDEDIRLQTTKTWGSKDFPPVYGSAELILETLKKSARGPFTTKTVLCVTGSAVTVSSDGSDCSCPRPPTPISVTLLWSGLPASPTKANIYSAITATGSTTDENIYIVDHWADGCSKPDKTRLLAAIKFDSTCTDTIELASSTSACEKIEWSAPTSSPGDYHKISIYTSKTDLPSTVSATAREATDLQTFLESLGAAKETFCYRDGVWSSDGCVCISAYFTDTNAENIFSNVLVKGATKLVFIDEDAASGSNAGGCAVNPDPAGKVLAYVTNIAKTNPSPACASGIAEITFREGYKGCATITYEQPTVTAGERLHQLKLLVFPVGMVIESDRFNGNTVVSRLINLAGALNELAGAEFAVVCAAEGTVPLTLSSPATTNGDCTCPAASGDDSNSNPDSDPNSSPDSDPNPSPDSDPNSSPDSDPNSSPDSDPNSSPDSSSDTSSSTTAAGVSADATTTAASNSALKSINTFMIAFTSLLLTAGVSSFV